MQKIYLDYQLILYLNNKKFYNLELVKSIEKLEKIIQKYKQNGAIFPYSPAHIEETAGILMSYEKKLLEKGWPFKDTPECEKEWWEKNDQIDHELNFIDSLSGKKQISQNHDGKRRFFIKNEASKICFQRVIDLYHQLNPLAEQAEKQALETSKDCQLRKQVPNGRGNMKLDDLLDEVTKKEFYSRLTSFTKNLPGFSKDLNYYEFLEDDYFGWINACEKASRLMEDLGFHPNNRAKFRNKMHDTTHQIYASYCNIFVTHDKNLYNQTLAIYSLLKVPCKVYFFEEFIKS